MWNVSKEGMENRFTLFKIIFHVFIFQKKLGPYIMQNTYEVSLLTPSKFIGNYFCHMKGLTFYDYSYAKNILSEIFGNAY